MSKLAIHEENKRREEQRAMLVCRFLENEGGEEFMEALGYLAGMHLPSHWESDRGNHEGLLRDGMKKLFCKVRSYREQGKDLLNK